MRIKSATAWRMNINGGQIRVDVVTEGDLTFDGFVFEKRPTREGGYLYAAIHEDIVRFYAYSGPGNGFGGARYALQMEDGTTEILIGPWSSRAGVYHHYFPEWPACTEVCNQDSMSLHATVLAVEAESPLRYQPVLKFGNELYYELANEELVRPWAERPSQFPYQFAR